MKHLLACETPLFVVLNDLPWAEDEATVSSPPLLSLLQRFQKYQNGEGREQCDATVTGTDPE